MITDSMPNASVALASSNPRDIGKKRRANRLAKLKQCKLDARREQWLSQVKNKGECKEEVKCEGDTLGGLNLGNKNMPVEKLEICPRVEGIYIDGSSIHQFSGSESSPSNSPTSSSELSSNNSGVNFTSSSRSSSSSSGRSSSCSTNGYFSGILSEEDEGNVGDDACLDDWESMADALTATEDNRQEPNPSSGYVPVEKHGNSVHCGTELRLENHPLWEKDITNAKTESGGTSEPMSQSKFQAWRPDDAFRPQSLPNLSQQCSFQINSEQHCGLGGSIWGCKNVRPVPTTCPICYEDFDFTDSSFVPCFCGFRLCLFCHKRILEEDGRCPGCRTQYECDLVKGEAILDRGSLTLLLTRSCSMTTRS